MTDLVLFRLGWGAMFFVSIGSLGNPTAAHQEEAGHAEDDHSAGGLRHARQLQICDPTSCGKGVGIGKDSNITNGRDPSGEGLCV